MSVHDAGPLDGLEELAAGLPAEVTTEEASQLIEEAGIPLRATMGLWSGIVDLFAWARGRRLVRELAVDVVSLEWFPLHVPRAGSATVTLRKADTAERSLGLRLFGTGYNRGRSVTIEVSEETDPRLNCARHILEVQVLPRIYTFREVESLAVEILGVAGTRVIVDDPCAACAVDALGLDPVEHVLEPFIDLRQDRALHRRSVTFEWSEEESFDVESTLPAVELPFTLNAAVSSRASWEITYELAPGYLYQPFRPLGAPRHLPPIWASTSDG